MSRLRLGPIPKNETVRLTIALPATVKTDLDRYAELYAAEHGEVIDSTALAAHMIATFMQRDRGFRRARQGEGSPASAATSAVTSSTTETAGESSPSR